MASKAQIEAARKALADGHGIGAAIDAAELAVWQPIETAPKDGTSIIGYDEDGINIMYYNKYTGWQGHYLTPNEEHASFYPTHWRTVPEAPKE